MRSISFSLVLVLLRYDSHDGFRFTGKFGGISGFARDRRANARVSVVCGTADRDIDAVIERVSGCVASAEKAARSCENCEYLSCSQCLLFGIGPASIPVRCGYVPLVYRRIHVTRVCGYDVQETMIVRWNRTIMVWPRARSTTGGSRFLACLPSLRLGERLWVQLSAGNFVTCGWVCHRVGCRLVDPPMGLGPSSGTRMSPFPPLRSTILSTMSAAPSILHAIPKSSGDLP